MTRSRMTRMDKFNFGDVASVYGQLDNLTHVLGDMIERQEDKDNMDKDEGGR